MNQEIEISTLKERLDEVLIFHYLSEKAYWAKGRSLQTILKTIANSFTFGVYKQSKQIGFARVITDYTTFYYLCDVFIIPSEAGNGYGKKLTEYVVNHPLLAGCRGSLMTGDAHGLYEQFGFRIDPDIGSKYMVRQPDAINTPSELND
ncbi:MAG TPA: GNAT family N-acetyltransferase [Bacteroidales bacterium]|nr:MAG: hypothetical protein A2X11_07195 [Bacteroidetes bacterium GWE2_42_24]OFY29547.1 MAG: hypothetical protein A2X09_04405 [Bacteroidetes bacterium GWF2_43_11]PKP27561.1 MAG: GNAT family N-acetyltransferase [Bacteroidetes bacterium HGW-Bacteroidetes-22]HAQ64752.1 GNAT family N-acetyltransferase [Bacteroidales bacterium]HBZ67350.1 GNAT family N-acetyltransferase [Bacteroidales bacterium]